VLAAALNQRAAAAGIGHWPGANTLTSGSTGRTSTSGSKMTGSALWS
jgi:hypothetical protein